MGIFESLSTSDSFYSSSSPPKFRYGRKKREDPHFLDSCFLCKRSLIGGDDIYMYRGDTAFCSEECRQEQIENDNAAERRRQRKSLKERNSSAVALRSEKVIHAAAAVVG